MTADVALRLNGINKRFGALRANDAVSLILHRGEILALLGENGAGKSTLMSIIYGEYLADSGAIEVHGKPLPPGQPRAAIAAGIGMVHQHFTLADNLSVLDNIMLGSEPLWRPWRRRRAARAKLARLSERFGLAVDPDAPIAGLSVGERQRVEILKALYRDASILILDEPTAVLTPQASEALFATLKQMAREGLSLIFISHKLNEVLGVSDRLLVLRAGRIVAERRPAGTRREELAELMVGKRVHAPLHRPAQPAEPVFELRGAGVLVHGRTLLERIDLSVRAGEIVGIAGVAGNGQNALADLAGGLSDPSYGERYVFGVPAAMLNPAEAVARGIGRIPEDRQRVGIIGELTLWQNAILERLPAFSRSGWLRRGAALRHTSELIERFAIRCRGPGQRAALLSGGNMQKLILGRVFACSPQLLVASQPSRGLDVGAAAFVHEQLLAARDSGAGVLLLSDDLDEILLLADRIAAIYRGRLSAVRAVSELSLATLGQLMAGHGHPSSSELRADVV